MISQKATKAEEGMAKAATECRFHCERVKEFHTEFAHLPRLEHAVNVIKHDLQQILQLCHTLELAYTDVSEGKVLVGLEAWRDEQWSQMSNYKSAKTRELDKLQTKVEQKQNHIQQKKAEAARIGEANASVHSDAESLDPNGAAGTSSTSTTREHEEAPSTSTAGGDNGDDGDVEVEEYYVTSPTGERSPGVRSPVADMGPAEPLGTAFKGSLGGSSEPTSTDVVEGVANEDSTEDLENEEECYYVTDPAEATEADADTNMSTTDHVAAVLPQTEAREAAAPEAPIVRDADHPMAEPAQEINSFPVAAPAAEENVLKATPEKKKKGKKKKGKKGKGTTIEE